MDLFFELIQVALGNRDVFSKSPTDEEWIDLFAMSQKQAVVGVAFEALDRLSKKGQKLPTSLFFEWIGLTEQIKQQNLIVNQRCKEVSLIFADAGFKSCILKGQGNAMMYPEPLLRQSGDIDLWVDASKEQILSFVKKKYTDVEVSSHHVEYPVFDDTDVEVHYAPGFSFHRRYQKRMERYIENRKVEQFNHGIVLDKTLERVNVPTNDFNIIIQLSHIQRHFFYGGIGIRHIVDLYYLLKQSCGNVEVEELKVVIKSLGLWNFTCGIMWVLENALGLGKEFLITDTNRKKGQFILKEIIQTGNFGQYEQRFFSKIANLSMTLSVIMRNTRMLWLFPEEAIIAPIDGVIRKFLIKN